ncbi:MAG: terminase small subunit [Planctomycetota bacterium]|jgi:hypothetical protein
MPHDKTKLTERESRFALYFVETGDKYKAFEKAGFESKNRASMASAVSRMLKWDKIKKAIAELKESNVKAAMVNEKRIIANLASRAFDEEASKADRNRSSELLGRYLGLFEKDNAQSRDTININQPRMTREEWERDAKERAEIEAQVADMTISDMIPT